MAIFFGVSKPHHLLVVSPMFSFVFKKYNLTSFAG